MTEREERDRRKALIKNVVTDFLSEDAGCRSLRSVVADVLNPALAGHEQEVVADTIRLAMDFGEREQETLFKLLSSCMLRGAISRAAVVAGLASSVERLPDMSLDVPRSPVVLALFIAHFVADRVLDSAFSTVEAPSALALDHLSELCCGDEPLQFRVSFMLGCLPMEQMKAMIRPILDEVFVSGHQVDDSPAHESITELHAPHYHHEVIKKMVQLAMEMSEDERRLTSDFISSLHAKQTVHAEQIEEGFLRSFATIDDMALDTPDAAIVLGKFCARAVIDGVLEQQWLDEQKWETLDQKHADAAVAEARRLVACVWPEDGKATLDDPWAKPLTRAPSAPSDIANAVESVVSRCLGDVKRGAVPDQPTYSPKHARAQPDVAGAAALVPGLRAPFFLPELVRALVARAAADVRAVKGELHTPNPIDAEAEGSSSQDLAAELLATLLKDGSISATHIGRGLVRVAAAEEGEGLKECVDSLILAGVVSAASLADMRELPSVADSAFVSLLDAALQ